eukprot:scaffold105620_cov38-Tisochrysis_lutea.AAC.1
MRLLGSLLAHRCCTYRLYAPHCRSPLPAGRFLALPPLGGVGAALGGHSDCATAHVPLRMARPGRLVAARRAASC